MSTPPLTALPMLSVRYSVMSSTRARPRLPPESGPEAPPPSPILTTTLTITTTHSNRRCFGVDKHVSIALTGFVAGTRDPPSPCSCSSWLLAAVATPVPPRHVPRTVLSSCHPAVSYCDILSSRFPPSYHCSIVPCRIVEQPQSALVHAPILTLTANHEPLHHDM